MQYVTDGFLTILRESHTAVCRADLYNGNTLAVSDLYVSAGNVTASRKENIRRTCDLTITVESWMDLPDIDIYWSRIQLYYGVETRPGQPDMLPIGKFRINEFGRTSRNSIAISGTSFENFVSDDRFFQPRKPPLNVSTVAAIKALITESIPNAQFRVLATQDKKLVMTAPWARERWDAITTLAESINAEVYCDPTGVFVIANKPNYANIASAHPVWLVSEGDDGVLVSLSVKRTRDSVYNGVVAFQSGVDNNVAPVWASVVDTNVYSKTYWSGPFGHVPRFYSNPNFRTTAQCLSAAKGMLAESIAEKRSVDFTSLPNPALEPGDVVQISMLDGTFENHLIDTLTMPLALGAWSATTKTSKEDIPVDETPTT